jgi:hypothetical protein
MPHNCNYWSDRMSPYADPAKQRRAQADYVNACRAAWLAKQRCVRCKGTTALRIFRKSGSPKPSWSRSGPSHRKLTVLCQRCVRRGREELLGAEHVAAQDRKNARERELVKRRAVGGTPTVIRTSEDQRRHRTGDQRPSVSHTQECPPTVSATAPKQPTILPEKPRRRPKNRPLTGPERRMMAEQATVVVEVVPCPVHGRTRAVQNEWGKLHYRCCGRLVA